MYSTTFLLRLVKALSVASIGIMAVLIVFGNVTDYNTNYRFVEHVLKMDTTFSNTHLHIEALTAYFSLTFFMF